MKRTLLTSIMAVLSATTAWAQNPFEPLFSGQKVVNTTSEQGRDRLDSLYCLYTRTYVLPYKGKKETKRVDGIVREIVGIYDSQLPAYTGGFCYSSDLRDTLLTESKQGIAYYSENQPPLMVGGKGVNYALLRRQDASNPNYRTVYGVEWRMNHACQVSFKVFHLYGPASEQTDRKNQLLNSKLFDNLADTLSLSDGISGQLRLDDTEFAVQSLRMLSDMYRGKGTAADELVADIAQKRFLNYMHSMQHTNEGKIRVMREMRIPGFYAEVTDGKEVKHGTIPWLAEQWKDLDIFCLTWDVKGTPGTKKYGEKSKYLLLQVVLQ